MFAKPCRAFGILLLVWRACLGQPPLDPSAVTFRTQSRLVLLSFHVSRGNNYVADLKQSDVVLLEDGKPRYFTIFDSAATQGRMPMELVLLFDNNPKIDYFWDPQEVFRFVPQWNEAMSRAILEKETADVRISVYHCSGQSLDKLSPATTDPQQLLNALRGILNPEFPGTTTSTRIPLSLPSRRDSVNAGPFTQDFPTSYFVSAEARGWPLEAAIGVLNDVAAAQDKVSRMFVMFSEGIGATTTIPEDVGNHALDLGIPIFPIATNYKSHIESKYPRNLFRMHEFEALGKMTGGRFGEYPEIDAATLTKILESVRNAGLYQYVVGFVPTSPSGKPKEHKLEIKLVSKSGRALEGGKRRAMY
jgi:VWFA-related protein